MNLRLLSAVVCVGFLTLAAPVYGAQSSDVVVDGAQRGDVQQTRYRETLLSLRDTLTVVRANMSRVRRQLATAGPETLQSWVVTLNRACGGSVTALENAEPRMVVKGTSARNNPTTDSYSLKGVTAAHRAMNKACGRK